MKNLVWKELRQGLRWTVAAFVVVSILTLLGLAPGWREGRLVTGNSHPFSSDGFLVDFALATAAAGLMLGLAQILPERRADRWALLVHRPVSRTTIFFGKVVAGLGAYLAATAVPFLLASWWAATSGHVPGPFTSRMMLPGLVLVVAGAAFYFAGLLTALRKARWYGSRGLGIAAAVLAPISIAAPSFALALLGALTSVLVLGVASWGSFFSGGYAEPQPRPARVALALGSMAGATLLVCLGVLFAIEWFQPGPPRVQERSWYMLDRQGRVFVSTETDGPEGSSTVHRDLAGRVVDPPQKDGWANTTWLGIPDRESSGDDWHHCGVVALESRGHNAFFYVRPRGVIEVHDRATVRRVGIIGPDQLAAAPALPKARFGELQAGRGVVFSDDAVYVFSSDAALKRVLEAREGDSILAAQGLYARDDVGGPRELAVLTERSLLFLSPDGVRRTESRRDPTWSSDDWIEIASLNGGRHALRSSSRAGNGGAAVVEVIAADGSVESTTTLPPLESVARGPSRWEAVGALFLPPGLVGAIVRMDLGGPQVSGRLAGTVALLGGFLSACAALVLLRRYSSSRAKQATWSLTGLVLGLPGFLTLLSIEDWPARIACPSCGRRRRVDRDPCHACGAQWPAPALDGTEIFDRR